MINKKIRFSLPVIYFTLFFLVNVAYTKDITSLSLEQLMEIEVSSATKSDEHLKDLPSAVFVITAEDIRRSGATTIADVLKMVPGLFSARVNSNDYAISVRGFAGVYSNKLLVLLDGKTLYNPLFSGVFWDTVDMVLDDIDRIEVIRGPGASLWGANAVNGIINIITKNSKNTKGLSITTGVGTDDKEILEMRYGDHIQDKGAYRIFFKARERDASYNPSNKVSSSHMDDWRMVTGGFRSDIKITDIDKITIEALGFQNRGDKLEVAQTFGGTTPCHVCHVTTREIRGGNILGVWERENDTFDKTKIQGYYDYQEATGSEIIDWSFHLLDLEYQQNKKLFDSHYIVWGGGIRFYKTDTSGNSAYYFSPTSSQWWILNGFLQDKIEIMYDKLFLYIGSKFEYHEDVGFNIQPSVKTLFKVDEKNTLWGSISKAIRVPSKGELNTKIKSIGPANMPFQFSEINISGNTDLNSEEMWAFELGHRALIFDNLTLDSTVFLNKYNRLISLPTPTQKDTKPYFIPIPHLGVYIKPENCMDGESYGFETEIDWKVNNWWRINTAYSYFKMFLHNKKKTPIMVWGEELEGYYPENILSVRSQWNILKDVEVDIWGRYVDNLPALDVDSYLTMDAKIAWKPKQNIEVSLVGQNLFDNRHAEYKEAQKFIPSSGNEIERSVYFQLKIKF